MNISNDIRARIECAAAALVSQGINNPTNEQVRQRLGGGSLSHISPVMRTWRQQLRDQAAAPAVPVPDALRHQSTELTTRLWQQACEMADADVAAVREQADADIAQADEQRDEALAEVQRLEAELAFLRSVADERDQQRGQLDELRGALSVTKADYAALRATGEANARQLDEMRAELKQSRDDYRTLQSELLHLARTAGPKKSKGGNND